MMTTALLPFEFEKPAETAAQESLDPQDWDAFRELAHRMLDRMIDHQRNAADLPTWQPVPESVEARFKEGPPLAGKGAESAYEDFLELVLPYPTGNTSPRFWGWVSGTGSPSGMVAEMLTGGFNALSGTFNDASARVESQVIDWMRLALGYPKGMSGVFTSGGSVANLIGLAVARDSISDQDIPRWGLQEGEIDGQEIERDRGRLVFYASAEVHSSVLKAAQILGLGREAMRTVPVDENFRIRLPELRAAIERDRALGYRPFAIVGNAGTVNTGATDDLNALADIAARERLWLHVDGAFGALVRLSPGNAHQVAGLERADSVAFDFHKWMYVPYEAGCVLIRDVESHRRPFTVSASYLEALPRGIAAQPDSTNLSSLQLSRGFKALKVWLLLKEHGFERYGRLIERNIEQARYLAARVEREPELELLAPVPLNIVCFRYVDGALDPEATNELNRELLMRLQEEGLAVPSSTVLDGRFAIRVAITNHRSRLTDFDFLVDQVIRLGRQITREVTR